jgi:hypothetical protein
MLLYFFSFSARQPRSTCKPIRRQDEQRYISGCNPGHWCSFGVSVTSVSATTAPRYGTGRGEKTPFRRIYLGFNDTFAAQGYMHFGKKRQRGTALVGVVPGLGVVHLGNSSSLAAHTLCRIGDAMYLRSPRKSDLSKACLAKMWLPDLVCRGTGPSQAPSQDRPQQASWPCARSGR